MEKEAKDVLRELKEDLSSFAESKLELLKISTYEKTSKAVAFLLYALFLSILILFAILFLCLSAGFFLSDWFDSKLIGFGIVAAICFIKAGVVFLCRNPIRKKIMNMTISTFNAYEQKKHATTDSRPEKNE